MSVDRLLTTNLYENNTICYCGMGVRESVSLSFFSRVEARKEGAEGKCLCVVIRTAFIGFTPRNMYQEIYNKQALGRFFPFSFFHRSLISKQGESRLENISDKVVEGKDVKQWTIVMVKEWEMGTCLSVLLIPSSLLQVMECNYLLT